MPMTLFRMTRSQSRYFARSERPVRRSVTAPLISLLAVMVAISGCSAEPSDGPVADGRSTLGASGAANGKKKRELQIGVTHVGGAYHVTENPYPYEGAEAIHKLGARAIKLYMYLPPATKNSFESYPFNCEWPDDVKSLEDLAETKYYRDVFAMPFDTIALTVFSTGNAENYWREGMSKEQQAEETRQFYELSKYLLTKYRGAGKTFILSHWEGDWALFGTFDRTVVEPGDVATKGMIDWLRCRQLGVDKARSAVKDTDVRVYHAAEVNRVAIGMDENRPCMANRVLPNVSLDLVSYSAWDTQDDPVKLRKALDYIAENSPKRSGFGAKKVYLGEFGKPEKETSVEDVHKNVRECIAVSRKWGVPYAFYWQAYCNEPTEALASPTNVRNDQVKGFYIIRPDGTHSNAWNALKEEIGR